MVSVAPELGESTLLTCPPGLACCICRSAVARALGFGVRAPLLARSATRRRAAVTSYSPGAAWAAYKKRPSRWCLCDPGWYQPQQRRGSDAQVAL